MARRSEPSPSPHYHAVRGLLPMDLGGAYVHYEPGPITYYRDDVEITAAEYLAATGRQEDAVIVSPSLTMDYTTGIATIVTPASLAGRRVVAVDGRSCGYPTGADTTCGLFSGHWGNHWECSIELVETEGPWAMLRQKGAGSLIQCERCLFWVNHSDMDDTCVCVDCARED